MSDYLHIAATFLDGRFHGRGDGGEPEWPPSPLRLMQAMVAATATSSREENPFERALSWLQSQPPPLIIAPHSTLGTPYYLSVPNNAMDIVARAWSKGNYTGKGDTNPAKHRTMKAVRPTLMEDDNTVHYLWELDNAIPEAAPITEALREAAGRMVTLGWGIDLVTGHADRLTIEQIEQLPGERWRPTISSHNALRTPKPGTLAALKARHEAFLHRMDKHGFSPVEPLTCFNMVNYRRPNDPISRPYAIFELRHDDGSFCSYPQRQLIHIAGMVRHLAGDLVKESIPHDADNEWVSRYVMGHCVDKHAPHRQLSYLPLPSIGHKHADQIIRRVIVTSAPGDGSWLEHVASRLAGRRLHPLHGNEFGSQGPPTLIRVHRDKVAQHYVASSNQWASVTPVILPGHNDHSPAKTQKLIYKALAQSGIEQPCQVEWSTTSHFRKSPSSHPYDRHGKPVYFKPRYLQSLTALHLTITFNDNIMTDGPIAIGAGRHCGFGLMAPCRVI